VVQTFLEILVILGCLAGLTLAGSGAVEAWRWLLGWPGLGREYWVVLLGGLALLALLVALLLVVGALRVGLAR
jgi:hypothetical protein